MFEIISGSFPNQFASFVSPSEGATTLTLKDSNGNACTLDFNLSVLSVTVLSSKSGYPRVRLKLFNGKTIEASVDEETLDVIMAAHKPAKKLSKPFIKPHDLIKIEEPSKKNTMLRSFVEDKLMWILAAAVALPCLYLAIFSTYSDVEPLTSTSVATPLTQPATVLAQPAPLSTEETNRIGDEAIRNSVMSRMKVTDDLLAGAELDLKQGRINSLDMYGVGAMLEVMNSSARDLQAAWRSHDKLTTADIAQLKSIEARLSSFQQRALPKMRLSFKKVASEMLWEQDIEVSIAGSSTIVFVGALFAANANIKQVQEQVHELLTKLRFKHARYQWYRGSRGSVYTLETPADAVIAVYDNGFSKLERGKAGTSR